MVLPKHFTVLRQKVPTALPWLLVIWGYILGALTAFLAGASRDMTTGLFGLVGVLLGATISAGVNLLSAREGRRAQIAVATWPKRLEKHQEALKLWRAVMQVAYMPDEQQEKHDTINEAAAWWFENCLYLSNDARDAFIEMITSARYHLRLVEDARERGGNDHAVAEHKKHQDTMLAPSRILIESAGGHISDTVWKDLQGRI